jgi:cytochrome b involved in lipid metabolism
MFSRRFLQVHVTRLARGQNINHASRNLAGLVHASQSSTNEANKNWLYAGVAAGILASLAFASQQKAACDCENPAPRGHPASALPNISYKDFKNDARENIWVTMDGGVYDVTAFLDAHPGGTSRYAMSQHFNWNTPLN